MTDTVDVKKRSWIMSQVRSQRNKSTELKFIEILKSQGITGWRRNYPLSGKPDFVFPKNRVAVFIDGCFWHGCAKHCRMPSSNMDYWQAKINRNVQRDRKINKELRSREWKVLRFWEHDLKRRQINRAKFRRLSALVNQNRVASPVIRRPTGTSQLSDAG